jgi:YidC/Oxa1 family membrane protein insertase
VNPLAGCLPALAQIPIFIGLYRSLLNLASDNVLDEPFLWLPR